MQSVVYKIIFNASGQYYIGSTENLDKRLAQHMHDMEHNCHSSVRMNDCYKQFGFDFSVEVLHTVNDRESAYRLEDYELQSAKHDALLLNTAVNAKFGDVLTHNPNRNRIRKNIGAGVRRRNAAMTEDERKAMYGQCGEANGRYIDGRCLQIKHCPVCNCLIGPAATACRHHVNRYGEHNNFYGHRHTDATKAIIASKNRGRMPANARKVSVDGVVYASLAEAARALHVVPATILHRCNSKNYATTFYID